MHDVGYSTILVGVRQIVIVGIDVEVPVQVQPRNG